ncbi:hypothetical protein PG999_014085 [Apiospora kogelbergensis]|uniref:Sodium/calcium exchanger membrane region domain-containing protein n=1 Tax=Apiospora kogelbergensis TaxID=1337665 RepID=A0AAW0QE14_9PEZI
MNDNGPSFAEQARLRRAGRRAALAWNPFRHIPHSHRRQTNGDLEHADHRASGHVIDTPHNTTPSPDVDDFIRNRKKAAGFFRRLEPKEPFTVANQLRRVFFGAWINLLLPLAIVGIVLNSTLASSIATFAVNFVAIIPLGFMAEYGLDEICLRVGPMLGGLVYISTSNFVQLISSIVLLKNGQTLVLKNSLVGSILANILLMLGLSILCGCFNRPRQYFNQVVGYTSANLLSLAATSLLIPTAASLLSQSTPDNLLKQSRGASFILMAVYISYLAFQFWTHDDVFQEQSAKNRTYSKLGRPKPEGIHGAVADISLMAASTAVSSARNARQDPDPESDDESEEDDDPQLHFVVATATFVVFSALLAVCVDNTVNSLSSLTTDARLSQTFIGLVLLPLPNCDTVSISQAVNDEMDNVISFTIGKCLQTALLVTPLAVLIGWGLGVNDMTLVFGGFEIVSLFSTMVLLNFLLIASGKSFGYKGFYSSPTGA